MVRRPQIGAGGESSPRILHLATSQNDGGVERYGVKLASALAQNGVWVRFACLPGAIVERLCVAAGVGTLPLTVRNSGDLQAAHQVAAHIRGHQIGIVHVHSRRDYLPALLGVAIARTRLGKGRTRPRLVLHAHMIRPLGTPPALSGWFFSRVADCVLAVSEAVRAALMAEHYFAPGFVRLLHNGVDVDKFPARASPQAREWRGAVRAQWGLPDDALLVAMIGRLDAKGQARVLQALPRVLEQVPNARVVLVGSEGVPGTLRALQSMVHASGMAGQVVFTGEREDIPQLLAASDMLAHLPTDESFGLALAEAMAAGLPTIATSIGGCREVVQNGKTGLLVTLGDSDGLTAALLSLLAGERAAERRARFGAAGRARAEAEFSLARQTRRLEEIYRELCPIPASQTQSA